MSLKAISYLNQLHAGKVGYNPVAPVDAVHYYAQNNTPQAVKGNPNHPEVADWCNAHELLGANKVTFDRSA